MTAPLPRRLFMLAPALWLMLLSCAGPCENTVLTSSLSPGADKRAVIFDRSCGATTGFSRQVSVLDGDEKLSRLSSGNVLVAGDDRGAVKEMIVTVRWASREQLVIRYPARARVFKKETQARGVVVAYETAP